MKKYVSYFLIGILISIGLFFILKDDSPSILLGLASGSNLTTGTDTDGGTSSVTSSVSLASNNLVTICVASRTNISADPNIPTATGNGLTWATLSTIVYDTTSASRKRVTVLRSLGASPSSGAITIDFGGQAQTDVSWSVSQFSGVDTSGTNGSGAVVQTATAKDESATTGNLTVTLGAFSSVDNGTYGCFSEDGGSDTATPGSGFTLLGQADAPLIRSAEEWQATNDTSVDLNWAGSTAMLGGIAFEIKAAVSAPTLGPAAVVRGKTIIQGKTIFR